jgi:hemoglobin
MREITGRSDIQVLVNEFYTNVQKDELLGPVFNPLLEGRWPVHLEKMYRFWETVLLDAHNYKGSPFPPHAGLPVEKVHFNRWLALFIETVDGNFKGEKATEAKWRAEKMAELFHFKIEHYREHPEKKPLF